MNIITEILTSSQTFSEKEHILTEIGKMLETKTKPGLTVPQSYFIDYAMSSFLGTLRGYMEDDAPVTDLVWQESLVDCYDDRVVLPHEIKDIVFSK